MADDWCAGAEARLAADPARLDAGLAREGLALFRELSRTGPHRVLLFTDLHAGNVLSGQRRPWLLIDPKPYVGDPHYDVLQHLLNCNGSLQADPIGLLTEVADLAGLDAERVRQWLFARCVQESLGDGVPWPGLDVVLHKLGGLEAPAPRRTPRPSGRSRPARRAASGPGTSSPRGARARAAGSPRRRPAPAVAGEVDAGVALAGATTRRGSRLQVGQPVAPAGRAGDEEAAVDVEHPDLDAARRAGSPFGRDVIARVVGQLAPQEARSVPWKSSMEALTPKKVVRRGAGRSPPPGRGDDNTSAREDQAGTVRSTATTMRSTTSFGSRIGSSFGKRVYNSLRASSSTGTQRWCGSPVRLGQLDGSDSSKPTAACLLAESRLRRGRPRSPAADAIVTTFLTALMI